MNSPSSCPTTSPTFSTRCLVSATKELSLLAAFDPFTSLRGTEMRRRCGPPRSSAASATADTAEWKSDEVEEKGVAKKEELDVRLDEVEPLFPRSWVVNRLGSSSTVML